MKRPSDVLPLRPEVRAVIDGIAPRDKREIVATETAWLNGCTARKEMSKDLADAIGVDACDMANFCPLGWLAYQTKGIDALRNPDYDDDELESPTAWLVCADSIEYARLFWNDGRHETHLALIDAFEDFIEVVDNESVLPDDRAAFIREFFLGVDEITVAELVESVVQPIPVHA